MYASTDGSVKPQTTRCCGWGPMPTATCGFWAWSGVVHARPTVGGWLSTVGRRLSTVGGVVVHGGWGVCPRDDTERAFGCAIARGLRAAYPTPDFWPLSTRG